jgi:DNA mismatch repair ATPase MutS
VYGWDLCKDLAAVSQIVAGEGVEVILTVSGLKENIQEITDIQPEILSNSEFSYEEGKSAVKELAQVVSDSQFATRFPEDLRPALHALSPLYRRVLQSASGPFTIDIGSREFLLTDLETLRNLQIIKDDFHPSTIKSAGRAKEGFSVFNLLDKTVTRQGRKLLRQWVLQPLRREDEGEAG